MALHDRPDAEVTRRRAGFWYGVAAFTMWGSFPLYWPLLRPSSALEILAHRIAWSLLAVGVLLALSRRLGELVRLLRVRRTVALLTAAAVIQGVNWGTYIHGVNTGQVIQTSLGYFIAPLVTVLFAVVVLHETLRSLQWVAVTLGLLSVALLTADYGGPPWIALVLGGCFACYALLKKTADAGAVEGLALETAVLAVPALLWLAWMAGQGRSTFGTEGASHAALLVLAGVVTTAPLVLFGASAVRVPLVQLGLLQYLAPVLQLFIGIVVVGEPMPLSRWAGFVLVWIALALLSADAWQLHRSAARPGAAPVPGGAS